MRTWPDCLTPELEEALGTMIFTTAPIAEAFRAAGEAEIPRKAEAEQAFVLHWIAGLALEHGPAWRVRAGERLGELMEKAKALKLQRASSPGSGA